MKRDIREKLEKIQKAYPPERMARNEERARAMWDVNSPLPG